MVCRSYDKFYCDFNAVDISTEISQKICYRISRNSGNSNSAQLLSWSFSVCRKVQWPIVAISCKVGRNVKQYNATRDSRKRGEVRHFRFHFHFHSLVHKDNFIGQVKSWQDQCQPRCESTMDSGCSCEQSTWDYWDRRACSVGWTDAVNECDFANQQACASRASALWNEPLELTAVIYAIPHARFGTPGRRLLLPTYAKQVTQHSLDFATELWKLNRNQSVSTSELFPRNCPFRDLKKAKLWIFQSGKI